VTLGLEPDRSADYAEQICFAILQHSQPQPVQKSSRSPQEIFKAVEEIADAAERIEASLTLLAEEGQNLPPHQGKRPVAIRYLYREICRAFNERLVPYAIFEKADRKTLDQTLPYRFVLPFDGQQASPPPESRSAWSGQFDQFAQTVRSIAEFIVQTEGTNVLKRKQNRPDFQAVMLTGNLASIFQDATGLKASAARRNPDIYTDPTPPFVTFLQRVWRATAHAPIGIDGVANLLRYAKQFAAI
jgi:hypothetical protein